MKCVPHTPPANPGLTPALKPLKDIPKGECFLFQGDTLEQAFDDQKGNPRLWKVINMQPAKTGRICIVSIDGQLVRECDDDHLVHPVKTELVVYPIEMVQVSS